ncbi:hypothetical protein [Parasutterella excrementihominis]|uniref:hypothetical protein n=1 Tax=Parasutterella excrementihominis TaxID=487175 RepID=UPI0026655B4B|nr:hypothetical protein [Parasutterella excrementihominis]
MLKQLIQLFAEKFLVCKKERVAQQRNTASSNTVELSLPNDNNLHTYTPPADGLLVLGQSCSSGACYLEVIASGARFNLDQSGTGIYQGFTVQVNRGQTVSFKASADNRGNYSILHFIPFVSQT